MNKIKNELNNPKEFQSQENFLRSAKYAIIVCNQFYDKKFTTMDNLPAVVDDCKNAL